MIRGERITIMNDFSKSEVWTESDGKPTVRDKNTIVQYLRSISGRYTIAGIHNREPNRAPLIQTAEIFSRTGVCPGLWSGDFLFTEEDAAHRWDMIHALEQQWNAGSVVNLMMHVTSPLSGETGQWKGDVLRTLTDSQWRDLITDGGELNRIWKKRLDVYSSYMAYLKEAGVTILFRPFHEMNQKEFWWGGRPGAYGTAALFRLTHDYLTLDKGLDNIIWVWDMQDLDFDWASYNPGEDYWDIFAVDVYNSDGFTEQKYRLALETAGDKPIAIGECKVLPTAEELEKQPRWTFFMSWAELTFQCNTTEQIQMLYRAKNVLTRKPSSEEAALLGMYGGKGGK